MKRAEKITKFLEGVGSLISVHPMTNNRKINLPEGMNHGGFKSDWDKIGQDMWRACQTMSIKYINSEGSTTPDESTLPH